MGVRGDAAPSALLMERVEPKRQKKGPLAGWFNQGQKGCSTPSASPGCKLTPSHGMPSGMGVSRPLVVTTPCDGPSHEPCATAKDLAGKSKAQLRDMLMGYAGTDVHLKIVHVDGSAENLNIVRETSGSPSKVSESELIRSGGNKGDLGIRFQRIQDGLLRVCGIQEGGGAFQSSGIHVGDAISFIDDVRVVDLDDQTIHSLFCGVPGSTVKLTVLASDSSERTVEVVRTLVKNAAFSGEMPFNFLEVCE